MFSDKQPRKVFVLSKRLMCLFAHKECYFGTKHAGSNEDQLGSRPKYNYGLTGKGKSKRRKIQDFPTIHGEVVFGLHPVYLALQAERRSKFHTLYIDGKFVETGHRNKAIEKVLEVARHKNIRIHPLSKLFLDQLAGNRPHQGVCLDSDELDVTEWTYETEVSSSHHGMPIWLLLHNILDPMNLGAILRTAYYLGLDKVVLPAADCCRLSPVVSKASAGALEVIDLVRLPKHVSEITLCEWWQSRGWEVVGTTLDDPDQTDGNASIQSLYSFSATRPTMVLLGNEGFGVGSDLLQACDTLVTIPSYEKTYTGLPRISSLNVSVAAGILLHWIKVSNLTQER
ncbi:rRNA methyltransferase 1, mitochondrial [Elysia marginata]|uniref:rRNA methyltransferase 1, mitochondrial n=1 Tax=Elysia marginata TaxID=1093978 RepID=A0AAV4EX46_9GAST|nr:rRNA methyltransferase 1, mitochondrial [Elysia marginata]